ncbi:MAG: hypothetical protein ABIJ61_00030 [bacterium]
MQLESYLKRGIGPLFMLLFLLQVPTAQAEEWKLKAKTGLSYDFISHDYYLRTIDTLGITPDSLLELKSYTDQIDERGGWLRLELERPGPLKLAVASRFYLTNEKFRSVVDLEANWQSLRLLSSTELKSYGNSDDFTLYQRQFRSSSRLGLALLNNSRRYVEVSQEMEYTGYGEADPDISGYHQSESRLRFRQQLGSFSDLELSLRLDLRDYQDTSEADFNRWAGDLSWPHIASQGYYSSALYVERRNYDAVDSGDDYTYLSPEVTIDRTLAGLINLAPEVRLHYYSYDQEDFATFSNLRFEGKVLFKYQYRLLSAVEFGLGTEQFAAGDSLYADQDYSSWQLLAGFETFSRKWLTLTADAQYGYRNYHVESDGYYTDYNFLRLDLLADIAFSEAIRLSLIAGTDWEYHADKEDNVFLSLLSATLTFRIR